MKLKNLFIILILIAFTSSCAREVGDSCSTSGDCDTGQICDKTLPGGYCTKVDCHFYGCPSESSCIAFNDFDNYCMLSCTDDSDCRSEYVCVTDFSNESFCGAQVEAAP